MKILLIFLTIFLSISCGDSIKKVNEYYDDGSLKLVYETFKGLKHGNCVEYYKNGNIKSQSKWINDTITGFSVQYYESGNIESTTMWLDGQKHGNFVKFDDLGFVEQTKSYQLNKQCGYEIGFYEGDVWRSLHFILLEDSTYLNQIVNYYGFGNIDRGYSSFYSIYSINENDTVQLNQNLEICIYLETPISVDSMIQMQIVHGKWNKYFSLVTSDTIFADASNIVLIYPSEELGIRNAPGIILNPYFDRNNTKCYQKFYFLKSFYVVDSLTE